MLYNHAQLRFQHLTKDQLINRAQEDLLAFAYIKSEPTVISTDWHKFAFNGYSSLGGQALELVISGSSDIKGAVSALLDKFYTHKSENKTDRVRLFYPALSFAFAELKRRNSDVGMVQQALIELNSDITMPLDEILNPEWVDPYTFEIDEFEFTNKRPVDVRKKYSIKKGRNYSCILAYRHKTVNIAKFRIALYRISEKPIERVQTSEPYIPMMEFDDEEFTEEEDDCGLAGDGLHEVVTFNYADMQNDYMLSGSDRERIKKHANSLVKTMVDTKKVGDMAMILEAINKYEEPHHKYAMYVNLEAYLKDHMPEVLMNVIKVDTPTGKMPLSKFHEIFGDDILESIIKDHTPIWTEMEMREIDQYCEETINLQALAYCELTPTKNVSKTYHYLQGYMKSFVNGANPNPKENARLADSAGWNNYRIKVSPEGHQAYQKAITNGATKKEAMKAFWTAYNNTIIAYSTKGLTLRSEKIDWRRAYYKTKAQEIPQSQIKKLFGVVNRVLETNPNDIWLKRLASLSRI
jgi:hypothetical protein